MLWGEHNFRCRRLNSSGGNVKTLECGVAKHQSRACRIATIACSSEQLTFIDTDSSLLPPFSGRPQRVSGVSLCGACLIDPLCVCVAQQLFASTAGRCGCREGLAGGVLIIKGVGPRVAVANVLAKFKLTYCNKIASEYVHRFGKIGT